jgi:hypothetical protein
MFNIMLVYTSQKGGFRMKVEDIEDNVELANKGRNSIIKRTVAAVAALAIAGCLLFVPWKLTGRMYPFFSGTYKSMNCTRNVSVYEAELSRARGPWTIDLEEISESFVSDYGTIYNSYLVENNEYELVRIVVNDDTSVSVWHFMDYYRIHCLGEDEKIASISSDNDKQQVFGIYRVLDKVKTK